MFGMGCGVDQEVVDVHNYIGEAVDDGFHQTLKAGGAAQQAHGAGDPLKLAHVRHHDGCVRAGPGVQNHLPEASREDDGTENSTARATDFANALTDVFHRILACVGLIVECSKILHQPYPSIFFHHCKYRASGGLNDTQFEPFEPMWFDLLAVCIRYCGSGLLSVFSSFLAMLLTRDSYFLPLASTIGAPS
jgi:hypothetical protein